MCVSSVERRTWVSRTVFGTLGTVPELWGQSSGNSVWRSGDNVWRRKESVWRCRIVGLLHGVHCPMCYLSCAVLCWTLCCTLYRTLCRTNVVPMSYLALHCCPKEDFMACLCEYHVIPSRCIPCTPLSRAVLSGKIREYVFTYAVPCATGWHILEP